MKLTPGLVGGHCIGIDPYYLMHKSKMTGYDPIIMRSARLLNDNMADWVLANFFQFIKKKQINIKSISITVMGYTFKENCSDIRNTKVHDLILSMQNTGCEVEVWDPFLTDDVITMLDKNSIKASKHLPNHTELAFICVYHDEILRFIKNYEGLIYDYKKLN
jgi:UDP-N-acetyl-D-galactosamine dehydrogenase